MNIPGRTMRIGNIYRYPRPPQTDNEIVDGYPNHNYMSAGPNGRRVSLESGINTIEMVTAVDGPRRPAVALRSSTWKAGQESTPWHDIFDLDHGHVRYFGDHKVDSPGDLGSTRGNAELLRCWSTHNADSRVGRIQAPPLLIFRSVTVGGSPKGYVEFCGVAVIERLEHVVQRDARTGVSFANFVFDLAVLDAGTEAETVDWRWIDDRRNATLSCASTLQGAPRSWKTWVDHGNSALARTRRRVATSRVRPFADQRPVKGTPDAAILRLIYDWFDGKKHAFELLAARVAADVFRGRGADYREGWVTRGGGDGGTDFVGRLDVGSGVASTHLVVLGQAKCVSLESSINAENVARVIARLQRGWIGVYVTTGVFTQAAQTEIAEDRYPIVLVDGRRLAETVQRIAYTEYGGDVTELLRHTVETYPTAIASRRPEEVAFL